MKFNAKKAKHEYITTSISYRELAKKHEVSQSYMASVGAKEKWGKLREEYRAELYQKSIEKSLDNDSDKLANLKTATDNLIEGVKNSSEVLRDGCDSQTANQLASAINKLIAAQRDLFGLLSEKDKLQYGKEQTETDESGVVFMPTLAPDADVVVSEGKE